MRWKLLALMLFVSVAGSTGPVHATGHFDSSDDIPDWAKCAYDTKFSNYC